MLLLRTNSHPPSYYAELYKKHNLRGGHVIKLGPKNDEAALEAIRAWPSTSRNSCLLLDYPLKLASQMTTDGLHVGGGITEENAQYWIDQGAEKVIVTSYLFPGAKFSQQRLQALCQKVGKDRLVVDVRCADRHNATD